MGLFEHIEYFIKILHHFRIIAIYLISNYFLCIESENVVLNCIFYESNRGYACDVDRLYTTEQSNVIGIRGNHMPGRRNDDVIFVKIINSDIHTFPQILLNEFQNLNKFWGWVTSYIRNIERLRNCSSLSSLLMWNDGFQTLKNSLFEECRNLNELIIEKSQISFIELDAFRGLSKLTRLWLGI